MLNKKEEIIDKNETQNVDEDSRINDEINTEENEDINQDNNQPSDTEGIDNGLLDYIEQV